MAVTTRDLMSLSYQFYETNKDGGRGVGKAVLPDSVPVPIGNRPVQTPEALQARFDATSEQGRQIAKDILFQKGNARHNTDAFFSKKTFGSSLTDAQFSQLINEGMALAQYLIQAHSGLQAELKAVQWPDASNLNVQVVVPGT